MNLEQYTEQVGGIFEAFFAKRNIKHAKFHRALVNTIVHCFHMPAPKLQQEAKARLILDQLFSSYQKYYAPENPFNLNKFIDTYLHRSSDVKAFLITLLYALYYEDINLKAHLFQDKRDNIEYLMFQVLAETVSEALLRKILKNLTFDKLVTLIYYALKHYREGSYYILKALKESRSSITYRKDLENLVTGLKRDYFDIDELHKLLLSKHEVDPSSLKELTDHLEKSAVKETQTVYELFQSLIPLIVDAPIRIFEENLRNKRKIVESYQPDPAEKERADLLRQNLYRSFEPFFTEPITFTDFLNFARLFGLKGHNATIGIILKKLKENTLKDKLRLVNKIYANVSSLRKVSQSDFFVYVAFALPILWHIEALRKDRSQYKEGLDHLSFALPTKGKSLDVQAALPSIVSGLSSLVNNINSRMSTKTLLNDYPIFVYDQSEDSLFAKNNRCIDRLNQKNQSAVIHISKADILALARKLNIIALIDTTGTGELGYGGARNTAYLLTPILNAAYRMGYKTIDKVLSIDEHTLLSLFQQYVLGGGGTPWGHAIFMADDDMEIPEANIYSHVMFSKICANQYFVSYGINLGRGTKTIPGIPAFKNLLEGVFKLFITTRWYDQMHAAWLSECLTKPAICLNLPLGAEENHLEISERQNFLLQPSYHLAGTRLPNKKLPSHYILGLENFFRWYIPYSLNIALADACIDPARGSGRCIFPWHDPRVAYTFPNLAGAFSIIGHPNVRLEMQKKFWRNVHDMFFVKPPEKLECLPNSVEDLLNTDINAVLQEFLNSKSYLPAEKQSLKKIAQVYSFYQQDAKLFKEFGLAIIQSIKEASPSSENWYETCIDNGVNLTAILECTKNSMEARHNIMMEIYPLWRNFYLLCRVAGCGEFCATIESIQKNNH